MKVCQVYRVSNSENVENHLEGFQELMQIQIFGFLNI